MRENITVFFIVAGLALLTSISIMPIKLNEFLITFGVSFVFWFLMLVSVIEKK